MQIIALLLGLLQREFQSALFEHALALLPDKLALKIVDFLKVAGGVGHIRDSVDHRREIVGGAWTFIGRGAARKDGADGSDQRKATTGFQHGVLILVVRAGFCC
ncbi:hypothetical protein HYN24_05500 [Dechloromonas sp. HYN0024]|nr:hypothetical protein HYN24_05500 [Dechloromonas sp. HYN0024]